MPRAALVSPSPPTRWPSNGPRCAAPSARSWPTGRPSSGCWSTTRSTSALPAISRWRPPRRRDVVKVERPEGDDARKWGPPFIEGDSVGFIALNRGKKSITCDLGDKAEREALIERIGAADVFIHNLRADVPAKFGIDGTTLTKKFPRLIYADLGAFGHTGPW